jgi:hypothetical protein
MGCSNSQVISEIGVKGVHENKIIDSKILEEKQKVSKPYQSKLENKGNDNLIQTIFHGILVENSDFCDCLIRSNQELETKLRNFISPSLSDRIKTEEGGKTSIKYYPNSEDEILNKNNLFDFDKFHLIALRGSYIERIINEEGILKVYTTDEIVDTNLYCAAIIEIPDLKQQINNGKSSWTFAEDGAPTEDRMNKKKSSNFGNLE